MQANKVLKNASWIIFVRIIQAVLNMCISMLTVRYLGPSNFGLISYAASIVAFAVPIMNLGLPSIMVQEIVMRPEKEGEILGSALTASLVSGVFSIFGVLAFSMLANHGERETIAVCFLYSLSLIIQAFDIIQYWFQAKLLSKYTSVIALIAYIIVSGYKVFLLAAGKSVGWFAVSYTLDYLIIAAGVMYFYRKLGGQRLSFSSGLLKNMFHKSKYYIISGVMITVFAQTDRIMLKHMIDETATGLYSAAVTCAGMTGFIFGAIIDSGRPAIFESRKYGQAGFNKNMVRLYSVVIYFALLQSLFIALLAKPIIYLLCGKAYLGAVGALRLVVWYTTFSYLGSVRNVWLLAEGNQDLIWIIDLSGAAANVLLNAALIPRFGIMGASFASLVTQIFANVVMGFIIKRVRPNNRLMLQALKPSYLIEMIKIIITKRRNEK